MTDIKITEHAIQRAKERFNLNDKSLKRVATKAWNFGFKHYQFKGKVKAYLDHKYLNNTNCNRIRIYGEVVYLFDDHLLVTLYKLPKPIFNQIERCLIISE